MLLTVVTSLVLDRQKRHILTLKSRFLALPRSYSHYRSKNSASAFSRRVYEKKNLPLSFLLLGRREREATLARARERGIYTHALESFSFQKCLFPFLCSRGTRVYSLSLSRRRSSFRENRLLSVANTRTERVRERGREAANVVVA